MLLQKREENSISLAATPDKGKVIDAPSLEGKVSPKSPIIMLIALVLGIAIPAGILFLREFFKYKIGLPEINESKIAVAQHVANPGCFATCIQPCLEGLQVHRVGIKDILIGNFFVVPTL